MIEDFTAVVLPGRDIILRAVRVKDSEPLFAIIAASRDHLEKWLPWVEFVRSIDDEKHIVDQWIYDMQMKSAMHLCIVHNENIIGLISTHQIDWMNQRTSIGYWMGREHTGKNFTTEATAILLCYLFDKLKLHRIYIQAATENIASNRVIRKTGFKWEGILRENERVKERFLDHNIYGMTIADFEKLKDGLSQYLDRKER